MLSTNRASYFAAVDCITWLISGRAICKAGNRPKRTPVSIARPTLKEQDRHIDVEVRLMGKRVFRQAGHNPSQALIGKQYA